MSAYVQSQPPSLENPFVGCISFISFILFFFRCLNLQAWRIPLWVINRGSKDDTEDLLSQPPSLENPFVGLTTLSTSPTKSLRVSTSKPGESLCGKDNRC